MATKVISAIMAAKEKVAAELVPKNRTGKKYRPSNGTEGIIFMDLWCDCCTKDNLQDDGTGGCKILADAFCYGRDEDEYPTEWQYDDKDQPKCTAFDRHK